MAHFYLDESLAAQLSAAGEVPGVVVSLQGADARHAVTVARVRPGESLRLGDGAGLVLHGTVTEADPAAVALRVEHVERHERPAPRILLAQALAKRQAIFARLHDDAQEDRILTAGTDDVVQRIFIAQTHLGQIRHGDKLVSDTQRY